jgi:hypothetical protein
LTLPAADDLRLDYEQTTNLLRTLTDTRFKLLAFVPTIAGAAVGLFGHPRPAGELLAIGSLGLTATVGLLLYELRNTQIYGYAIARAQALERRMGLESPFDASPGGGLFADRPPTTLHLFGALRVEHRRALALVYGAATAGWVYLTAWGALHALDVESARRSGLAIGVGVGVLLVLEIVRLDSAAVEPTAARAPSSAREPTHAV